MAKSGGSRNCLSDWRDSLARRCVRIETASTATSRRCFMPRRLKRLLVAGSIAFIPYQAFAQTSGSTSTRFAQSPVAVTVDASLATPAGHEVNVGVGGYTYVEPGD